MKFSNQIKEQRKKLGFTQEEIAKQLYVTRQTVSNWEQGKSYPDLNMLVKISDVYKMSIDSMLKEDTHLQTYLDQGKAYDAFSIFRGLIAILYGLFFLITDELNYNSPITQFYFWGILIIFLIAFLYGEYVTPFFLGINKQSNHKTKRERTWLGKSCNALILIILVAMIALPNVANYLLSLGVIISGFMCIFQKYMFK